MLFLDRSKAILYIQYMRNFEQLGGIPEEETLSSEQINVDTASRAEQWLLTQARPLSYDLGREKRKATVVAESEKPLSEETIHRFAGYFVSRIDDIFSFSNKPQYYSTPTHVIMVRGKEEKEGEGNIKRTRSIKMASIQGSLEATKEWITQTNDWTISLWVQQGLEGSLVAYLDKDMDYRLSEEKSAKGKRKREALENSPRAVSQVDAWIQHFHNLEGIR